jgi:hypothetical protein
MAAAEYWIEYADSWRNTPLAFWVHIEQDGEPWFKSNKFLPEAPKAVPHKGFVIICVEIQGTVLYFSSSEQLAECIRILSLNPLPTTRRLSTLRGTTLGPNRHWLSRLPAKLKSPKMRPTVVYALNEALRAITST